MAQKYKSEAFAAIHETMEMLHEEGVVDTLTMRNFDESCLVPVEDITAEDIRQIREEAHMSQPVLARYLNVPKNLVSDWERGVRKPEGPALRLLAIIKYKGLAAVAL